MPIPKKILKHLEAHKIKFGIIEHRVVYTAYDAAQTMRRKLHEIAKTLLVKTEKGYAIVVVPASHMLDIQKLKKVLKTKKVEIAKEGLMKSMLKAEPGSLTPFSAVYALKKKGAEKLPVYVDAAFGRAKRVITNAGSFTESLEMSVKHFLQATEGQKVNIAAKKVQKKVRQKLKNVKQKVKKAVRRVSHKGKGKR